MDLSTQTHPDSALEQAGPGEAGYMSGWGNEFATEALPGALPVGQNSPQVCPYGLYAEQISGTAFTAPRASTGRGWSHRIRPSAGHGRSERSGTGRLVGDFSGLESPPARLRWGPLPMPGTPTDFFAGLVPMGGQGDPGAMTGCAIHLYAANAS